MIIRVIDFSKERIIYKLQSKPNLYQSFVLLPFMESENNKWREIHRFNLETIVRELQSK